MIPAALQKCWIIVAVIIFQILQKNVIVLLFQLALKKEYPSWDLAVIITLDTDTGLHRRPQSGVRSTDSQCLAPAQPGNTSHFTLHWPQQCDFEDLIMFLTLACWKIMIVMIKEYSEYVKIWNRYLANNSESYKNMKQKSQYHQG